jgi:hypothetical protein
MPAGGTAQRGLSRCAGAPGTRHSERSELKAGRVREREPPRAGTGPAGEQLTQISTYLKERGILASPKSATGRGLR